ncbi:hypothetical protein GGR58DRAFT_523304 [Xylaria digitata]|nr:hypothetical protein GGR58DRAFT_523304 [Xylaria digitata]
MNQGYPVHIGAWTNWSRGQIVGAMVTLTRQDAALVIAFTTDNEVLIQSAGCGYVYLGGGRFFDIIAYNSKKINSAANYAQQCYSNQDHQFDCDHFVKERIIGNIDNNATCPFNSTVCLNESGNIRIDSGFINSHLHLGLNAPIKERILWRNVLHCAPLTTANFTSLDTESQPNNVLFHYGNMSTLSGRVDYMFRVPDLDSQYAPALSDTVLSTDINYHLDAFVVEVKNRTVLESNSDFMPIDALVRADADTHLIFLTGNGVVFSEHTDDAWYNVSRTATDVPITQADEYGIEQVYFPQAPASPLACADQHQFCTNDHPRSCGPLASIRDAMAGAAPLFDTTYAGIANSTATTERAARFTYFTNTFFAVNRHVAGVLGQLGSKALLSQESLLVGFQGPLASNQWQLDVTHWWDISMAIAQAIYLDSAYGLSNPALEQSRMNYTTAEFDNVCHNQCRVHIIEIFGLIFTYLVGFLLALVSYLIEPVSAWLYKRRSYGQYKHLEWTTNATLQLQRLAHEGIGQGTWSKGAETIPTTKEDESLALLDISNCEHPVLLPLLVDKREDSLSHGQYSRTTSATSDRNSAVLAKKIQGSRTATSLTTRLLALRTTSRSIDDGTGEGLPPNPVGYTGSWRRYKN